MSGGCAFGYSDSAWAVSEQRNGFHKVRCSQLVQLRHGEKGVKWPKEEQSVNTNYYGHWRPLMKCHGAPCCHSVYGDQKIIMLSDHESVTGPVLPTPSRSLQPLICLFTSETPFDLCAYFVRFFRLLCRVLAFDTMSFLFYCK